MKSKLIPKGRRPRLFELSDPTWWSLDRRNIPYEHPRDNIIRQCLLRLRAKYYSSTYQRQHDDNLNHVFNQLVIFDSGGSWVLNKIRNSIANAINFETSYSKIDKKVDIGKLVFFEHYLPYCDRFYRGLVSQKSSIVWFTHLRKHSYSLNEILFALNNAFLVIFQSKHDYDLLASMGLKTNSIHIGGGVDEIWNEVELKNYTDTSYDFLISSNNYPRKSPMLYQKLVEQNPDLKFCFLGRGWSHLNSLQNVTILEIPYEKYPQIFANSKCLLSFSLVEGGPLSLLEAVHCGLTSVISKTGLYKEYTTHPNVHVLEHLDDIKLTEILKFSKKNRGTKQIQPSWNEFGQMIVSHINIKIQELRIE